MHSVHTHTSCKEVYIITKSFSCTLSLFMHHTLKILGYSRICTSLNTEKSNSINIKYLLHPKGTFYGQPGLNKYMELFQAEKFSLMKLFKGTEIKTYIYLNFPDLILVPRSENFEIHSLKVRNYGKMKNKNDFIADDESK